MKKKANPAFSAGARYERKALRLYLRRRCRTSCAPSSRDMLNDVLAWVLARETRYGKKAGGL